MNKRFAFLSAPRLLGASLALLLLGAATSGRAESQITGKSPTNYAPITSAQQELQIFQRLQYLRNTGQISAAEYQKQVMALAVNTKDGMGLNRPPPPVIDLVAPPPTQPLTPPASRPAVPPATVSLPAPAVITPAAQAAIPPPVQPASPAPARPARRPNPMAQIQRPAGVPVLTVQWIDVSDH